MQDLFIDPYQTIDAGNNSISVDSTDIYESYLQPDNYEEEYQELDDYEVDSFFESSQLHRLVHTQPIHLINQQEIMDYTPQPQQLVVEDDRDKKSFISPMMTSRSSSMSSTFSKRTSTFGNYYDSIYEEVDSESEDFGVFFGGKEQSKPLYSAFYSICNPETTETYQTEASVPRAYACRDAMLDLSSRNIAQDETIRATADRSYHYSIQTSNTVPATGGNMHQPSEEEIQFVKAINLKLSRYAGYFTAGSKDQEYSDKVRFQEISYKFSKTYFQ